LTIAGGALEVAGFTLIAYDLYRVQRHEYGTPQFIQRWKGRIRRILRLTEDHTAYVDAMTGTVTMTGRGKARMGSGDGIDERLDALEENFKRLDEEVDEHRAAFDRGLEELREELRKTRIEVEQHHAETEQRRKDFQRTSVLLQACGTAMFLSGTVLSVLGSVAT
jgi:hypothetical protein